MFTQPTSPKQCYAVMRSYVVFHASFARLTQAQERADRMNATDGLDPRNVASWRVVSIEIPQECLTA